MTVILGSTVVAVVDPRINDGADEAPAVVTRLRGDGSADLSVSLNGGTVVGLSKVKVFGSRASVDKYLSGVLVDVPLQPEERHGPNREPEIHDALKWVSAAYERTKAAPAPPADLKPPAA